MDWLVFLHGVTDTDKHYRLTYDVDMNSWQLGLITHHETVLQDKYTCRPTTVFAYIALAKFRTLPVS